MFKMRRRSGDWLCAVSLGLCLILWSGAQAQERGGYCALKTNLVCWSGSILNIAADVQVGRHVSVDLPVMWCPWYMSKRYAARNLTFQPEMRWWFGNPGDGHFCGAHFHVSWFNVRWRDKRYQDASRPLLGAGVSYGYLLLLNRGWACEFTVGAGYAAVRYDTFYNIGNGACIDRHKSDYWGITRLGISVVYCFYLKSKRS